MGNQVKRANFNVTGKIILLGHHDLPTEPVYIGWVESFETHELTALLYRLRKTRPWLEVMYWRSGSLYEVLDLRKRLCRSWAGFREWFDRTPEVEALLEAMSEENWAQTERFEMEIAAQAAKASKQRQRSVKASRKNMPA